MLATASTGYCFFLGNIKDCSSKKHITDMGWNSPHSKFIVPFARYIEKYELCN